MNYTLQGKKAQVRIRFIGHKSGGFHEKFTTKLVADNNIKRLRRCFDSSGSTLMVALCGSVVRETQPGETTIECDALITTRRNHNLLLRPADCPALVIFSESPLVLALVHCSRTGLDQGIIQKTMKRLVKLGVKPSSCKVYIGPGIGKSSYVLPMSILSNLSDSAWVQSSKITNTNVTLDLQHFIIKQLRKTGISDNRIARSRINTATSPNYYSHYRATRSKETNGRNGFVCAISST